MGRFLGTLSALAALVLLGATAALAQGNSINQGRHTICHATGSESNPFVVITPAKAGVFNGHLGDGHQNGEDIIPPFEYDSDRDGTFETYSQNWDAEGQAIFENECELVVEGGGPGGEGGEGGAGAGGGALGEVAGGGAQGAQGALPFTGIPVALLGFAGLALLLGGIALMWRSRTDG